MFSKNLFVSWQLILLAGTVSLTSFQLVACESRPASSSPHRSAEQDILPESAWAFPGNVIETDAFLPIVEDLGVPAQGLQLIFQTESGSKAVFYDARLDLSNDLFIRQQQIQELSRKFGRVAEPGVPLVSDSAETYFLSDFIPARMQSLQGMAYPKRSKVAWGLLGSSDLNRDPVVDNFVLRPEVRRLSNCWTTAYELLRPTPLQFSAWFASDRHVAPYLESMSENGELIDEDTQWTSFVKELTWQQACVPNRSGMCPEGDLGLERNQGLQVGDLLLVHSRNGLEHAAVYMGRDLYFEKTGAKSADQLYRLVPYSEIANGYPSARRSDLRFRFRRPRADAVWPDPRHGFADNWSEIEKEVYGLMPTNLRDLGLFPSWQPEVGDARDLGIYTVESARIVFDQFGRAHLETQ